MRKRVTPLLAETFNALKDALAFVEAKSWIFLSFVAWFNVLDALLTTLWVKANLATEANPLLAFMMEYEGGMASFLIIKCVTITALIGLLHQGTKQTRYRRATTGGVLSVFTVYSVLMTWHAAGVLMATFMAADAALAIVLN